MIFFYISLSTYFCFLVLKFRQGIILLDNNEHNLKKYIMSIKKNYKDLFLTPELFGFILIVISIQTNAKITGICFVIFYTLMFLYFLKKKKEKINLKNNVSLIIIMALIFILVNIFFYLNYLTFEDGFILFYTTWIYYTILVLLSYFSYFVIFIAEIINKPIELFLNKKHKLNINKKN